MKAAKELTDGPPDCCDPCKAAKKESGGAYGTVVCCAGKKYSCYYGPEVNKDNLSETCIEKCVIEHEDSHHPETVECDPKRKDAYRPNLLQKHRHLFRIIEMKAHKREQDCLDRCCGSDPKCKKGIEKRKKDLEDAIKEYGKHKNNIRIPKSKIPNDLHPYIMKEDGSPRF